MTLYEQFIRDMYNDTSCDSPTKIIVRKYKKVSV